jgi:dTDP-4-amino-4,6-dideoxygalactose transaminase
VQKDQHVIPHSRPTLGQDEIRAVTEVMESLHIAQGEKVSEFENQFADRHGAAGAVACNSGTAALHLALLALGVGVGQEVIIPSYVCTALLNAVSYVGATPIVADIDPCTFNLDPADVKKRLTPRTAAIIVPHMFGRPAEIVSLLEFDTPLIEDCAQSLGSTTKGRFAGSFGDLAVFSFYATKVITTGEGGMVVARSKALVERIRDLREYDNRDDYQLRYNYKLTDIQAAMGLEQLDRLPELIRRRRVIAAAYDAALAELPATLPTCDTGHIYFRYVISTHSRASNWVRHLMHKQVQAALPVYKPLHRYLGLQGYGGAEEAWRNTVSIPIYPSLSDDEVQRITDACQSTFDEK